MQLLRSGSENKNPLRPELEPELAADIDAQHSAADRLCRQPGQETVQHARSQPGGHEPGRRLRTIGPAHDGQLPGADWSRDWQCTVLSLHLIPELSR